MLLSCYIYQFISQRHTRSCHSHLVCQSELDSARPLYQPSAQLLNDVRALIVGTGFKFS